VHSRTIAATAFLLVVLATLAGCGSLFESASTSETPAAPPVSSTTDESIDQSDVVAIVNGQPIYLEAYQRELARFEAGYAALGFEVADETAYHRQVLDLLIERELVQQRAASEGVAVSDEEVDTEMAAMISESGQENFDAWLLANMMSQEEFREALRIDILTRRLTEPLEATIPETAEQVHARHILVNTQQEAEDILARLQAGEDFATLAADYSLDMTSARAGGDIGWFPRGRLLVPEVEEAAFSLGPGETSGVIQSSLGFHIVQTLEYDPARAIDDDTRQQLLERAAQSWFDELWAGADIQILLPDVSADMSGNASG
jgi:parvulin-like peptidyl-prolyl isomerase